MFSDVTNNSHNSALASELTRDYLKSTFKFSEGAPEDFAMAYKAVYNVIYSELTNGNENIELYKLKEFFNR